MKRNLLLIFISVLLTVCTLTLNVSADDTLYANPEYLGEGVVVAVIDNGFDISKDYFKLSSKDGARLTEKDIKSLEGSLNGDGKYHSAKVPFVYDYAMQTSSMTAYDDHGTHIAGIIGANGKDFKGIAPEAQLLLMKVFASDGSSTEDDIIAAINDAVTLGADVINMSVGIAAGYSDGRPFGDELADAIKAAEDAGVVVVCAAGNAGRSGISSRYHLNYGIHYPTTTVIDSGTVATPATFDTVVAVGGLVSDIENAFCFRLLASEEDDNGEPIRCTDSSYTYVEPIGKNFSDRFADEVIEYVPVGGLGTEDDYLELIATGISVEGKIALIKRGEISFVDKLNTAAEYGAVGAVVYDNAPTETYSLMQLEGATIPGVFISDADGQKLLNAEYKFLTFKLGDVAEFPATVIGQPDDYTSWGVTPELKLKPDLTAVGTLKSTARYGKLDYLEGTSQASAYTSGCAALWCEYFIKNGIEYTAADVRLMMMNSAGVNVSDESGIENSPRVQGAGEVDPSTVGSVGIVITSSDGLPKVELGDKLGSSFKYAVTVSNIGDSAQSVEFSASMLTDEVVFYTLDENGQAKETDDIAQKSEKLPYFSSGEMMLLDAWVICEGRNISRGAVDFEPYVFELLPDESIDLQIEVRYSEELFSELCAYNPYGFFAEGYLYADVVGDAASVSLPFIGFTADWSKVPVYDGTVYGGDDFYGNTYLYTDVEFYNQPEITVTVGQNLYDETLGFTADRLAFSPNGDGLSDSLSFSFDSLRSVKTTGYYIENELGEVVYSSGDREYMRKNYIDSNGLLAYSDIVLWGGRDMKNANYVFPNGTYTVVFYATPSYTGARTQYLTFDIELDTRFPELVSYDIVDDGEHLILTLEVTDNHYIMGVSAYCMRNGRVVVVDLDEPLYEDTPSATSTVTFELPRTDERYIYIDIADYACNVTTGRVENPLYVEAEPVG